MNRYNAKLVRLQARRTEQLRLDSSERAMIDEEETTLYHLIKSKKGREARIIPRTQDMQGRITETPTEIARIFVAHWKDKYNSIDVSDRCNDEMLKAIRTNIQPSYAANLEQPITPPTNQEDPTKHQVGRLKSRLLCTNVGYHT